MDNAISQDENSRKKKKKERKAKREPIGKIGISKAVAAADPPLNVPGPELYVYVSFVMVLIKHVD